MTYQLGNMWTDTQFEVMNWHDNLIESITFPSNNLILKFQINYILEWIKIENQHFFKFNIALAELKFYNVINLNIELNFEDTTFIYIDEIVRKNKRLSPNQTAYNWDYTIITDKGNIAFQATTFSQQLISTPKVSDSQKFSDF